MPADPDMALPLTLRTNRWKLLLFLLSSAALATIGILSISEQPFVGYLCAGFFGPAALVFAVSMLPNSSYLRLTVEGFTFCSTFRRHTVTWRETGEFGVTRVGGRKLVAWNPSAGGATRSRLAVLSKAISGYAAALPDNYGLSAERLCELLDSLRRQYGSADSLAPSRPPQSVGNLDRQ